MIAVIVQARLGSTRFPRKVLADLNGKPVLQHVMERAEQIGLPAILATPDLELAQQPYVQKYHLGSEHDVLGRFAECAKRHRLETIIRITADCPLIQPELCRKLLRLYWNTGVSYAAIAEGKTFPKGYGCEVFSRFALDLANAMAGDPHDREHVTTWIEDHCHKAYLTQETDEADMNYCVDTIEDLERIRRGTKGENKSP